MIQDIGSMQVSRAEWLVHWWASQFLLHLSQSMPGRMSKFEIQQLVWKKPLSCKCQSMRYGVLDQKHPPVQEQSAFPPGKAVAHGEPCSFPHGLQLPGRTGWGGILVFKEGRRSLLALEHGQKEGSDSV